MQYVKIYIGIEKLQVKALATLENCSKSKSLIFLNHKEDKQEKAHFTYPDFRFLLRCFVLEIEDFIRYCYYANVFNQKITGGFTTYSNTSFTFSL